LGKEVLNFTSQKAYQFFVDAKDTHKSWQTLQILLFGTAMELVKCYKMETEPLAHSVLGFFAVAIQSFKSYKINSLEK